MTNLDVDSLLGKKESERIAITIITILTNYVCKYM